MSSTPSDPVIPRSSRALVVMARAPSPGTCKTRLTPLLSALEAAELYRAFLVDIARELSAWGSSCDLWVSWAGKPGDEEALRALFGPSFRLLAQRGGTLTERMVAVFDTLQEAGYRDVVMRNSDSPHLPVSLLDEAFAALAEPPRGTVVLGPDLDGGYYLVGLDVAAQGVFPTTMSTASVFEETVALAEGRGLQVLPLETFLDVDTPDDLALLWLEFGGRADVRHWATWTWLDAGGIIERLEDQ